MRLRHAPGLLLAVLLLATWQSALVHPLLHVSAHGGYVHVPGNPGPHAPGDHKKTSNPQCDALAAVTACVAGFSASMPEAPQRSLRSVVLPVVALPSATALAYRSQAPPALL